MKRLSSFFTCHVLLVVVLTAFTAAAQEKDELKPMHAPVPIPGVEPEMLTPEYWISQADKPDEIVSTPEQIEAWNTRLRTKKLDLSDRFGKAHPLTRIYDLKRQVGLYMHPILPLEQPATVPGDSLKTWIAGNLEWLRSRDFYDHRKVLYNERMINEIEDMLNLDAIPATITRRFGVITGRGDIRLFPTIGQGFTSARSTGDQFQNTSIYMTVPVTILHESRDGDYYYVESPIARGWLKAETVAIASPDAIRSLTEAKDTLMATDHKVPVYGDRACKVFRQYLYFSGFVPLEGKTGDYYAVKMPQRNKDGKLSVVECYVKADADVSEGFLPYTRRNVITQIFKLLYQPYGWADMMNNRDCSGTMRVLYRCFGYTMGRWPNFLLLAPKDEDIHLVDPSLSEEEKIADVADIEPFITVTGGAGHIALWLGRGHNGKYYFMHQGGWSYKIDGQEYYVNQVNINDVTHRWYNIRSTPVFATIH